MKPLSYFTFKFFCYYGFKVKNDVLSNNPYHLDSLLVLNHVLHIQDDMQQAHDCIGTRIIKAI